MFSSSTVFYHLDIYSKHLQIIELSYFRRFSHVI